MTSRASSPLTARVNPRERAGSVIVTASVSTTVRRSGTSSVAPASDQEQELRGGAGLYIKRNDCKGGQSLLYSPQALNEG